MRDVFLAVAVFGRRGRIDQLDRVAWCEGDLHHAFRRDDRRRQGRERFPQFAFGPRGVGGRRGGGGQFALPLAIGQTVAAANKMLSNVFFIMFSFDAVRCAMACPRPSLTPLL